MDASVISHLFEIKERPGMYLGTKSVRRLRIYLEGYFQAMRVTGTDCGRDIYRDFCGYLNEKYKEERSVIYDRFLPEICGSDEYAFDRFFTELEQYLSSRRTSS